MSIYDVKLYGAYYQTKDGMSDVFMSDDFEQVLEKGVLKEQVFEAIVLKNFKGRKDVLRLKYDDNSKVYETLYDSGYTYKERIWEEQLCKQATNAFFKAYSKVSKKKYKSIFDMKFCACAELKECIIELVLTKDDTVLEKEEYLITASVLRDFYGKRFVVKVKKKEKIEYIPIFSPKERFNKETRKWVEASCESNIPKKILESYFNYIK